MKVMIFCAGLAAILLTLTGCNSPNTPSFVKSDNLTRIEVTNNQNGQKGLASTDRDNLNELINVLHLGDISAHSRQDLPQPPSSAYTIVAFAGTQVVWTVQVLDSPASSRIYLSDAVHPANSGIYPLKQAIKSGDLDHFDMKYPAS